MSAERDPELEALLDEEETQSIGFVGFTVIEGLVCGDQRDYDHTAVMWVDVEADGSSWYTGKTFADQEEALSFAWAKAREDKEVYVNGELCTLERLEDTPVLPED